MCFLFSSVLFFLLFNILNPVLKKKKKKNVFIKNLLFTFEILLTNFILFYFFKKRLFYLEFIWIFSWKTILVKQRTIPNIIRIHRDLYLLFLYNMRMKKIVSRLKFLCKFSFHSFFFCKYFIFFLIDLTKTHLYEMKNRRKTL